MATEMTRLSDQQVRRLILASIAGAPDGALEEWIRRVLDWAEDVLIDYSLLRAVLRGHLTVDASGDELAFRPTERGEREMAPDLLAAIRRCQGKAADA